MNIVKPFPTGFFFLFSALLLLLQSPVIASPANAQGNPVTNDFLTCVAKSTLVCYQKGTSNKLWENPAINDSRGLILTDRYLYLTQGQDVKTIDVKDGSIINSIHHGSNLFDPILSGNFLILSNHQGEIKVINSKDSTVHWKRKVDSGWLYPPAVYKNMLFTGGQSGTLWALNLENGELLWHKNLNQELVYRPVLSAGSLLVSTFDGIIRNLDFVEGKLLWQKTLSSPLIDIQVSKPGRIIASGFDGKLYALEALSGKLLWDIQAHNSTRFNYFSNSEMIASIDHLGHFKMFDPLSGELARESKFEGNYQASPLLINSSIWLYPDKMPVVKLNLSSRE